MMISCSKKMLLPLFVLALQPMMIPSLMRESFIHPSIQAFSLDSNETTTDLPSPVDFVGTVKKMEPAVVPLSPSAIWDITIPSITSLKEEVKLAVSVAAKDLCCEISDAKIVFINDKTQTLINNFWADVLVATAPFRFGTAEVLDEMTSSFVESLAFLNKKVTSWKEENAAAAKDFYNEMSVKFKLFVEKTHAWINECMSDALNASAPFRLATSDLFDQITMSATTSLEEFSSQFQAVTQDLSNAIDSNCQELSETFETAIAVLASTTSLEEFSNKFQTVAQDLWNAIDSSCQELYETFETVIGGLSGFAVYLPLVMQSAIAMMVAAILVCFLVSIATVTILGCKILIQAVTQNVVHDTSDGNDKMFESNLFTFDHEDEESNLVPFDPSSIAVAISLTFSIDERINLISPPIAIESPASTRVADDSLVNAAPPAKVTPAAEKTKKENGQFVGPSFVEYRDPQPEFDDEDDDDDDESSVASAASIDSDDPEAPATDSTHRHPDRLHFDFFDRREPHNDFDDEEEDEESTDATTDDFDASMEDLLFSFSNMSFKEKTPKTVSDSEMDDLVNALANF